MRRWERDYTWGGEGLSPRARFKLAYRFLRSDGQHGAPVSWEMRAKAFAAWEAWIWYGKRHQDPLYVAATRRTYAMIDLHLEREANR